MQNTVVQKIGEQPISVAQKPASIANDKSAPRSPVEDLATKYSEPHQVATEESNSAVKNVQKDISAGHLVHDDMIDRNFPQNLQVIRRTTARGNISLVNASDPDGG